MLGGGSGARTARGRVRSSRASASATASLCTASSRRTNPDRADRRTSGANSTPARGGSGSSGSVAGRQQRASSGVGCDALAREAKTSLGQAMKVTPQKGSASGDHLLAPPSSTTTTRHTLGSTHVAFGVNDPTLAALNRFCAGMLNRGSGLRCWGGRKLAVAVSWTFRARVLSSVGVEPAPAERELGSADEMSDSGSSNADEGRVRATA